MTESSKSGPDDLLRKPFTPCVILGELLTEVILRDVPMIYRPYHGGVEVGHDIATDEIVSVRLETRPAPPVADPRDAEISRLTSLVYVPGFWRCPKCDFRLFQANINAGDGRITSRDKAGEKCPNCDSPLWRVTERESARDLAERCTAAVEDARKLRVALKEAERFMAYFAGETNNEFVGSGTPASCLAVIREALGPAGGASK